MFIVCLSVLRLIVQMRIQFGASDGSLTSIDFNDDTGMGMTVQYPPSRAEGTVTVKVSNSLNQEASASFRYRFDRNPVLNTSSCLRNCIGSGFHAVHGAAPVLELHLDWPAIVGRESQLVSQFDNSFGTILSANATSFGTLVTLQAPPMQGVATVEAQLKIPSGEAIVFPFTYSAVLVPTAATFDDIYSSIAVVFSVDIAASDGEFSCDDVLEAVSVAQLGGSTGDIPQGT